MERQSIGYCAAATPRPNAGVEFIQFTCTSPTANLAMEEYLARRHDSPSPTILLFRNRRAVVVGRNQNPWLECDPGRLARLDIPLIRRISGGGAVYHDAGNLNYSFILPRNAYAPEKHVETVRQALLDCGVDAVRTERNDLAAHGLKISGTAYMLSGKVALHHGTLLVDADLDTLRTALKPTPGLILHTKAVPSVRSPVGNLKTLFPSFDENAFVQALIKHVERSHGPVEHRLLDTRVDALPEAAKDFLAKYHDPEWTFGRTPNFVAEYRAADGARLRISVEAGRVADVDGMGDRRPGGPALGEWFDQWLHVRLESQTEV